MMKLYFTEQEMCDFLTKNGYTIKSIKTWKSYNVYHNDVENTFIDINVAYKDSLDEFNDPNGTYRYDSVDKYKVETIFLKEMKLKLLSL